MKAAFLLTQSLDSPGGIGRFGPLARELVRLGHEVDLLALHYAWDELSQAQRRFVEAGVQVHYAGPMHVRKQGSLKTYYKPAQLLTVTLSATVRLARALWRSSANVIQICKPQPVNCLAARLARRGRPVVCDCDDYEAETNTFGAAWQKSVVRFFEDGIVQQAQALTVNTIFTQQRMIGLGFPSDRIVYLPNGVERSRFSARPDPLKLQGLREKYGLFAGQPVVVYVGTMSIHSHPVDLLLEAFRQVLTVMPEARLMLVGGGEDFDTLQRMAINLGIDSQTYFVGRISAADIPMYLGLGHLSVDPVRHDLIALARSPLKIVESLSVGTPVVTADVGDRRALLDGGRSGILVPPDSSTALASGILELLSFPERRDHLAAAAWTERERWFWDVLVQDFLQVYRMVGVVE